MPRVTVRGDLRVGSAGFFPAGSSEVTGEALARFMAHPLFAADVASGRVKVEGADPAAVMAPEPPASAESEQDEPEPPKRGRAKSS